MSTATDATVHIVLDASQLQRHLMLLRLLTARVDDTPVYAQIIAERDAYPGRCPRAGCTGRPGTPCTTEDGQGGRRAMVVLHLERLEASRA